MEGVGRFLLSLTVLIFISVATFEELDSRIDRETELDDTELIQHAFDINSVEPSGQWKDSAVADAQSNKQSDLSSLDEKQHPADSQHVHETVVTEKSADLKLNTVVDPHAADKLTNPEHRPPESNPSNVVPTNSGTVNHLTKHLLANLHAHRTEQSKNVDSEAPQFAQQSDQPTKPQAQGTGQPVAQSLQAAGQPSGQVFQSTEHTETQISHPAGQTTGQSSQGTEHREIQTSQATDQPTQQALQHTEHSADQLSTSQYAQQTAETGQSSEQPSEVSGRPRIESVTVLVTPPSQVAQSTQAPKEHFAQLGTDQPSEHPAALKETVDVSVKETVVDQPRNTADSSPQDSDEPTKTASVEGPVNDHFADQTDTSVPAAAAAADADKVGDVHDTAEQNYTVDFVEVTEEDLTPQSLDAENYTVVEESSDNTEAESHEMETGSNYGVEMEDMDKEEDVTVGDDVNGDARAAEIQGSEEEGDEGIGDDNNGDAKSAETQVSEEEGDEDLGDDNNGDAKSAETQGSEKEGGEDLGDDNNGDAKSAETQGSEKEGGEDLGDDNNGDAKILAETQSSKEKAHEGVGDNVNSEAKQIETQNSKDGDVAVGDKANSDNEPFEMQGSVGVADGNSDAKQVTTVGSNEEDKGVGDDVNADASQIKTQSSISREGDEGVGDKIVDKMLGNNPDLTSEPTKSDEMSSYGQFVAFVDVLLTMLDDGLDGAIHEMPPSLQILFTNAPLALSPPRCLLVFIATCTGLFFLITVSCVQMCRQQRSSTKNVDLCDHLFTVENSLLVAEQENEDLHQEVDTLKARVREFEIRSNLSSSETDDLIVERDGLKAEIASKTNLISLMETTLSSQDSELRSCTNENKTLKQKLKEVTEHCTSIENRLLESQTTLQHSQTSALEMQSQLQSMTDEISLLQSCKDRLMAESEGCNEKMQDMSDQISKLLEEEKVYQESLALKDKKLDELCLCFAQLKSFEVELLSKAAIKQEQQNKIGAEAVTDGTVVVEDGTIDSVDAGHNVPTEQDDELPLNQQMKDALQGKLRCMMDVANVTAKLKTVENEYLSLKNVVSAEVKGRQEMEERLKVAQAEIARLTESRQEAELQANAAKVRMDVISGLRSEKDREYLNVCSKMAEYEARLKDYANQLASSDSRFKENESVNQSLREQIDKYQQEIQKIETEYGRLIAAQEKKAHENWLSARQSERLWKEEKTESQSLRQKLLELQTKLDILSQEPPIIPAAAAASENAILDESGSSLSSIPPGMPADRRSVGFPMHDGFMMRPPPMAMPPYFPGPMLPVGDRSLPPHLRDMRHTPPISSPMFDMRMRNPLPIPPPFDMFRGPPLYPSRSPSSPDDRGSPRDFDRSPSSIHSPIPARGSSPTLSRKRASPPSYHRGRPASPPQFVDRGPPHVARPRPELGAPVPGTRGPARNQFPPRNDRDSRAFMSSSPS